MRGFLRGAVSPASYLHMLHGFISIYSALEEELSKNRNHPSIAPIYDPRLTRLPALKQDLAYFVNTFNVKSPESIKPSIHNYVTRIQTVSAEQPELLAAHSYVRYLGDLSGGQILKRILTRSLKLNPEGPGVDFYSFDQIEDVDSFKESYRRGLDSLPLSSEQQRSVIDEAIYVFQLNMDFFEELSGNAFLSLLKICTPTLRTDANTAA